MDIWFHVTNAPLTHSQTIKNSATQLLRSRSGALVTQRNIFTFYSAVSVPLMTVQVLKDIRWHFQPSVIFDNHPHHCNLLDHHFEYSITWRLPLNLSDNLTCLPTSAYAEKQKTLFLDKKQQNIRQKQNVVVCFWCHARSS